MRGLDGVYDTTRLLRRSPFGEWVNVYFDPTKISESELLKHIKANRCPRAELLQAPKGKDIALLNAYAASGDVVQVRLTSTSGTKLVDAKLPDGWKLLSASAGSAFAKGTHYLSIQVAPRAKQGAATIRLNFEDGAGLSGQVAVVRQVGKH